MSGAILDITKCSETGVYKMSDADYFSIPALSNSGISKFIQAPAKFRHMMLEGWGGSSDVMNFGSLYHCHMLTPSELHNSFGIYDLANKRGNAWKDAKTECEQLGLTPMLRSQLDEVEIMRQQAMTHKTVRSLLNHKASQFELAMFWTEEIEGVNIPCKAKLDIWNPKLFMAADLKSTRDSSEEFARSIANYGYHRQAAWYSRGVSKVFNQSPRIFAFLCQDSEAPYMMGAYGIAQDDQIQALKEIKLALINLADLLKSDEWIGNYNNEIEILDMPRWAKKEIV